MWGLPSESIEILSKLVRPAGVEPTTFAFGGQRSIQLSYGRMSDFGIMRVFRTLASKSSGSCSIIEWQLLPVIFYWPKVRVLVCLLSGPCRHCLAPGNVTILSHACHSTGTMPR